MNMTGMNMTMATAHPHHTMSMGNVSHVGMNMSSHGCMNMTMMMQMCSSMNMTNHGMMNMTNGMHHTGGMEMGMHMMMMMPMYFEVGKSVTILFKGWKTSTVGELIGSLIALFVMAVVYEGIKIFREELKKKEFKSLQVTGTYDLKDKNGTNGKHCNGQNGSGTTFIVNKSRMLSTLHMLQTFLHMVQVFVGYLLMLAVMTFNVWIFVAIIVGSGTGYFLFGWKRASIVDVGDHCL